MACPAPFLYRFRRGRRTLSDQIQTRFRQARPGSVLILVVALLVLLALMGTAYISTTQTDRSSSAQNTFNTEIDLLIDGVCKIEQQQILAARGAPTEVFDQSSTAGSTDAMLWTSPQADPANAKLVSGWLGSRIPVLNTINNMPMWPYLSAPPLGIAFESPYVPIGQSAPFTYSTNTNLQPTSITIQTASGSTIYPALTDGARIYLAGSASNSGIADAGLFRLPIGQLNGITYYGSAYTIDNSSAVNASIAYDPNAASTLLPGHFFPTAVNLAGMLQAGAASPSQQLSALNAYRWGGAPQASLTPVYDDGSANGTALPYSFNSPLEAMWMQLGRRLDNPGFNTPGVYYQTLPIGESMALAYRHCLMNPAASPSLLEQDLAPSVTFTGAGVPIRTAAYSADQAQQWLTDNFIYDNGGGNMRPLLVARNQISNVSGSRFTYRKSTMTPQNNAWDSTIAYKFGDWVTGYGGRNYVCIQDVSGGTQPNPNDSSSSSPTASHWAEEPWIDYPVKTSINTGTFGQLWLGYWGVMSSLGPDTPDPASAAAMFRNPIRSAVSASAASSNSNGNAGSGNTLTVNPSGGDDTANVQGVINSSAAGDTIAFSPGTYTISSTLALLPNRKYSGGGAVSGIASLTPPETLRLRAAIAAINSQQLRGNNSQILSRQIVIGGSLTAAVPTNSGGATLQWTGSQAAPQDLALCAGGSTTEFTGFTVTGTGCELDFQSGTFNIHDNTFTNCCRGMYVLGVSGHFDHNTFTHVKSEGVYGYPSSNGTYDNNTFDYVEEPIHLVAGCDSIDVSGNVITHLSRFGIELQLSMTNLTVNNNYIGLWTTTGGYLDISCATGNGNNITLKGNTLLRNSDNGQDYTNTGGAIEIMGSNVTISGNTDWGFKGFLLSGVQGPSSVSGNTHYGGAGYTEWGMDGGGPYVQPTCSDAPAQPLSALNPLPAPPTVSSGTSGSTTQPSTASISYRVMLYGTGQQPYITEVYANNDQSTNGGFVAVAIYNPYSTPIALKNWQFATVNRAKGVAQLVVTALDPANTDLSGSIGTLASHQRVVFASKQPADMPTGITVDSGATFVYMPKLTNAFNNELVLIRPRDRSGNLGSTANYDPSTQKYSNITDPNNVYDETNNLADFVPVDSYDFSGLSAQAAADDGDSAEWHYVRPSDIASHNWYFVYPYTYDSNTADNTVPPPQSSNPGEPIPTSRLFATQVNPGAKPTPTPLGAADSTPASAAYAAKGFPIQINNTDFGGPKANATQFPFGGFARNGDVLQTTFIGAYRIDLISTDANGTPTSKTVEYQPVTMDAAFADDLNDNDNQAENVGRFCPLSPADCGNLFNDFDPSGPSSAYHFAMRLYDFLTVAGPADDYMQGVRSADTQNIPYGIANVKPNVINAYSNSSMATTEDAAPIDGLININTAPWRVLATLPLANNAADNITLAKAIVQYRDVDNGTLSHKPHGPFKSILELNGVPNFRTTLYSRALNGFIPNRLSPGTGLDNGPVDGDLAPFDGSSDQVPGDFEKQFLAFNRISNLVTVRSDSFTTYVLVQGWRNAGTATPELVVQRRAAFISDRSASVPSNKVLNITNIPVH